MPDHVLKITDLDERRMDARSQLTCISVVSNDTSRNVDVRFTDVYANQSGQWQMVAWQSTRLPE